MKKEHSEQEQSIGVEVEDRYGIFLTGEYSTGNDVSENDYRAGVTLKAVF
jgi:energy-converting hydrogenase Eha subunit B